MTLNIIKPPFFDPETLTRTSNEVECKNLPIHLPLTYSRQKKCPPPSGMLTS